MSRRLLGIALATLALPVTSGSTAFAQEPVVVDPVVVTATARPEKRSRIVGTVQVIDSDTIERSRARSLTDLLAENAVGFLSEWTPGQTSMNIRGAASDGQGRDFRGQVLVLINGHRAGTANLSKLSPADVERIEIVRGPSSVVYGSQNMGGVINIIMKTGRSAPGNLVELSGGSWGLLQGHAQTGGTHQNFDWYLGVTGGRRSDYHVGGKGGRADNTAWKRAGVTGSLGWQLSENHHLDLTARTDGIYDVGFRGSGANLISVDDRFNQSIDLGYSGKIDAGWLSWFAQFYAVRDIDNFYWASPVVRNGNLPGPGTTSDHNRRKLVVMGTRVQPRITPWAGNDLLLGWDWERSVLRSTRTRVGVPGTALAQVPPYDNDATDSVHALYVEDAQSFFDSRLTVRGGLRYTFGRTTFDDTPNLALQRNRTENYTALTYSAGVSFKALDWLTLRAGASSGFRAPTASELAADFTAVGGGRIFGNPSLRPEKSRQIEAGVSVAQTGWRLDGALFQNTIMDRITTRLRPGAPNTSDYVNNPDDIVVQGVELSIDVDVLRTARVEAGVWQWSVLAGGYYNFRMKDKGVAANANSNHVERMYRYEASIGTRFGQTSESGRAWSIQVNGLLRGPMWYNTEENLLVPGAEPFREYIHRKAPFWVWNLRGEIEVVKGVSLFGAVNNLFNANKHPIFIALDKPDCIADRRFQNGGCGTSMPGREFQIGLRARF